MFLSRAGLSLPRELFDKDSGPLWCRLLVVIPLPPTCPHEQLVNSIVQSPPCGFCHFRPLHFHEGFLFLGLNRVLPSGQGIPIHRVYPSTACSLLTPLFFLCSPLFPDPLSCNLCEPGFLDHGEREALAVSPRLPSFLLSHLGHPVDPPSSFSIRSTPLFCFFSLEQRTQKSRTIPLSRFSCGHFSIFTPGSFPLHLAPGSDALCPFCRWISSTVFVCINRSDFFIGPVWTFSSSPYLLLLGYHFINLVPFLRY